MSEHTELLDIEAETLSSDDDDFEDKLIEIASKFRGFDEAFTQFLSEHGYSGNLLDVDAKAKFLRNVYKSANVKPPHDFKEWFVPNKKLKRKTVFPICFAFGLNISETNDFFRSVQLERSFDCHTIEEVVYYFCIKNRLSYTEACEIIKHIPKFKKSKSLPTREILYTGKIIEYIDSIENKEDLIKYISDNIEDFEYNNATAIRDIKKLWNDISKEYISPEDGTKKDGLAIQEGKIIDGFNVFQDRTKKSVTDTRSKDVIEMEVANEKKIKLSDRVIATDGSSTWVIFSQIMGLDNETENEYASQYDRSLAKVLDKNVLLPLNASWRFPNMHEIDKFVRGDIADNSETIRKMIIFLVFYRYWAERITGNKKEDKFRDPERCLYTINKHLLDAGYPELFPGNPYDWIFMWALNGDKPLDDFRAYIGEIFAVASLDE